MKKPIRFIYFDVGNVIVNNDEAMERVARTHKVSKRDVYDIVYTHWREACLGKLSNEAYMDVFTQRLGITHPSHNMTEFWSDFQSPIPETYAFIHELSQSYRMGLLSNAENEIFGLLQKRKKFRILFGRLLLTHPSTVLSNRKRGFMRLPKKQQAFLRRKYFSRMM